MNRKWSGPKISKTLAELMGGSNTCESEYEKGSVSNVLIKIPNENDQYLQGDLMRAIFSSSATESTSSANILNSLSKSLKEGLSNTCVKLKQSSGFYRENSPNLLPPIMKRKGMNFISFPDEESSKQKTCSCPEILIADDNTYNIFVLRGLIKKFGFECDHGFNGSEVIEKVIESNRRTCCYPYRVILIDVNMPIKGGLETTKDLRKMIKKSNWTN